MNKIAKILLTAVALLAIYILISGIGWADAFFWKTGVIAQGCSIMMSILVPLDLLPITPGSRLDTPWFFIPAFISALLLWAIVIRVAIDKFRTRK